MNIYFLKWINSLKWLNGFKSECLILETSPNNWNRSRNILRRKLSDPSSILLVKSQWFSFRLNLRSFSLVLTRARSIQIVFAREENKKWRTKAALLIATKTCSLRSRNWLVVKTRDFRFAARISSFLLSIWPTQTNLLLPKLGYPFPSYCFGRLFFFQENRTH